MLKLILGEAKSLGIDKVLLTINVNNKYSLQTALANGGVIEKSNEKTHYVWITCG